MVDAPKHTPGPWINGPERHWPSGWIMAENVEKGPMHVADIRGWGYLTGQGSGALGLSHTDPAAIQDANARLIAAAPELLAELQRSVEAWDPEGIDDDFDAARTAIARATGAA